MLSDGFGRQFEYLRVSLTDVCNFSCQYCLPDGYQKTHKSRFLSSHEVLNLVEVFASLGTKKVRITGGEPSLRKDLSDIIAGIKQNQHIQTIALTTNGYKLTQNAQDWYNAGLDSVNVSVDSFDEHQFKVITGSSKLKEILLGIDRAIDVGLKVKINLVLMKQFNHKVLGQVMQYIKDKPVSFRFIELMETGDNAIFFNQQHVSPAGIQHSLIENGFVQTSRDKFSGPARVYSHQDYVGTIGLITPYASGFCDNCNRLRVSSTGKVHLCLFAEKGYDIRWGLSDERKHELASHIEALMPYKKPTHLLQEHKTGATTHLAMLGG
ncbi:GTP 3',8-cyclase MoaA [Glaciecola petra]|uniref:GTP 3',8-cyclase n=1 Tax=Glaciecola petra TaxID=3075602 RepID=A0ABU2ZU96_9ALTE|nr:GTP 3',8-cyclase MoaA [Aestuariibacter sp. P117]MDT0595613.1 GTP 3',8-cyclase MoaA [Aestuariibacter sp. P117]